MWRAFELWMALGLIGFATPMEGQQWQTTARWHRSLKKAISGKLSLDEAGIEFQSAKLSRRWAYLELQSFDLSQRELTLFTYENRPWREPGERTFHFTLAEAIPPEVMAQPTGRVGKPVRNGAPVPGAPALAEFPAHRRQWSGGSNGMLRIKDDGIDYLDDSGRDSRSWRWADIQTLAHPSPYELRVNAYREIVEFDLKQPLPRGVFEDMWDRLYATGLNLSHAVREVQQ